MVYILFILLFGRYYQSSTPVLVTADPDMAREILIKQFDRFDERLVCAFLVLFLFLVLHYKFDQIKVIFKMEVSASNQIASPNARLLLG